MKKELKKEFAKPRKLKVVSDFNTKYHRYLVVQCEENFNSQEAYHLTFPDHSKLGIDENKSIVICTTQRSLNFQLEEPLSHSTDSASTSATSLSPRERQIVQLVAKGYSNKQIARYLSISTSTVATHLRRIFTKLDVDSRAAMVYRWVAWVS